VGSFSSRSAAGPSGLRPQHMLDCISSADGPAKTGLLEAPLLLVTTASAGSLHPVAGPYMCVACLIPPRKNDVGLRPIVVVR